MFRFLKNSREKRIIINNFQKKLKADALSVIEIPPLNKVKGDGTPIHNKIQKIILIVILIVIGFVIYQNTKTKKEIHLSALGNKFIGVDHLILYKDNTFRLLLDPQGEQTGYYKIKYSNINLYYQNEVSNNWPDTLEIKEEKVVNKSKNINMQINSGFK